MPNKVLSNITSVYTDKSINGWVRGLIWVGTIVVVYVAGKAIYGKLFPSSAEIAQKEREKQLEDDINTAKQTQTPSFLATQYNTDADAIVAAFSGCDWTSPLVDTSLPIFSFSDSYKTVWGIISNYKNDLDVLSLQKAFGKRTISKHYWCGGDYNDIDLEGAIIKQLNKSEIDSLNKTLVSKGITKVKF
jgi:hypothetical protein